MNKFKEPYNSFYQNSKLTPVIITHNLSFLGYYIYLVLSHEKQVLSKKDTA